MNWKFWKQKVAEVPQPVIDMTDLEQWILADLQASPDKWTVRTVKETCARADSRGVTILSGWRQRATCGVLVFGKDFSRMWHNHVLARIGDETEARAAVERNRVTEALTELFEPVK